MGGSEKEVRMREGRRRSGVYRGKDIDDEGCGLNKGEAKVGSKGRRVN